MEQGLISTLTIIFRFLSEPSLTGGLAFLGSIGQISSVGKRVDTGSNSQFARAHFRGRS